MMKKLVGYYLRIIDLCNGVFTKKRKNESYEFIELLKEIQIYLNRSIDSDWSSASVHDMEKLIDESIELIEQNMEPDKDELELAFSPTSYLQEISMASGWSKEFLILSNKIDLCAKLLCRAAFRASAPGGSRTRPIPRRSR
jgi:hypothetical protein